MNSVFQVAGMDFCRFAGGSAAQVVFAPAQFLLHEDGEVLAIVTIVTERYRTQYALLYPNWALAVNPSIILKSKSP